MSETEGVAYVVQVQELIDVEPDEPYIVWRDLARVEVPRRTKRDTVIRKALERVPGPSDTMILRVLSARSAQPVTVALRTPEPQLVIGNGA